MLTVITTSLAVSPIYSLCLLVILTCHEFGHYFAAKLHRVQATLPFFIPAPFGFGTFGAVIRMSPYIPNRKALFDIAAAGPIAGLVVALPISFIGMLLSEVRPSESLQGFLTLGDPLIFRLLEWLVFGARQENYDLLLHDVAFAGWVGMFVTALNLLPISQLDGGHIVYAAFGRASRYVAAAAFAGLAVVTFVEGLHYALFLALIWFMGVRHPPTLNDAAGIGGGRGRLALLLLVVFILCFTPAPFQV